MLEVNQRHHQDEVMETSRFTKAVLFAWVPAFFLVTPILVGALRSISRNKATGLGAVAGGLSEGLVTFGIVAMFACEVYAVVWLVRTFSKGGLLMRSVAIASIGCGAFCLISLLALVGWLRFAAVG